MSSRDFILNKIRQACVSEPTSPPTVPFFHTSSDRIVEKFQKSLEMMGGDILPKGEKDPYEFVKTKLASAKIICPVVPEIVGNCPLTEYTTPASLQNVDYGVIRASFGVAETGSICLTDQNLLINTLGYLPQHLIILLDPTQIVENLHDAYARPEWKQVHYAALHSGPSATADIEGVLIRGAQGVRSLSVFFD
ncbi:LutC/YkgG family protein [Commensalibacter oyaizuii]|uniref:LUD domain-containing protein n=1 Tax=Commensalibacter oyaizuii TaxID=3043873 RepID=A0ABT6Q0A1_9PROT|nr:LUD domain-containing protein [Commensalibacter sp. TBRC 16381]MDI2090546.1 LUD domain-containing protein [Commensalibacter sp. TBRC 16381]